MKKVFLVLSLFLLLVSNVKAEMNLTPKVYSMDGTEQTLEEFFQPFKGQVVLVNFWATWCPYCRKEMPKLDALQGKMGSQGVKVVGIALDREGYEKVNSYVADKNFSYTIVAGDSFVASAFGGADGIPTSYIVDREGDLVGRFVGVVEPEKYEEGVSKFL